MRILYLSQYFPPEVGATQTRAFEMARHLVSSGHRVTVLTEVPNHPAGVIRPEYRGRLYERASLEGIDVIRVWVMTSPDKTFSRRMAFYISYMVGAAVAGLVLARGQYDAIFATSPPLFVGAAALGLSYLRRIPLVFEVRDLWPESAVALGELTHPRAIALASNLEEMCYNRARSIVAVTRGIQTRLLERGLPAHKVVHIPNGANTDLFRPDPVGGARVRAELGLEDAFVVLYAGIHGLAQGLETVLEAAVELQAEPDVHFVLVGEGPRKAALLEVWQRLGLSNVTFLPEQRRETMPAFLSGADVALVPLRDLALFRGAVPSKLFDAWACGCPVLLSIAGEARRVLEQAEGGLFVPPEDAHALAEGIRIARSDACQLRRWGQAGRTFTVANYSRAALAARLEALLRGVARRHTA
jgi:colanic acid biosynthesis glycosyl transferase WcaI